MTSNVEADFASTPPSIADPSAVWPLPGVGARRPATSRPRAHTHDWMRAYRHRVILADFLCAITCVVVAVLVSGAIPLRDSVPVPYLLILLVGPFAWAAAVASCHGYERRFLGVGTEEYRALVAASVRLLALCTFISYAVYTDRPYLSRFFVLVLFPLLLCSALAARYGVRKQLHRGRRRGRGFHRAVVVGRDDAVAGLIRDLQRERVHGIKPVAACTTDDGELDTDVPREGSVLDAVTVARAEDADLVVVASPSGLDGIELRRLSWELDDLGTELIVSPGVVEVTGPRMSIRPAANLSLLHIERPALHGLKAVTKTVFDRVVAGTLLVLLSPLFVLVALLVKVRDGGAVFFRQTRVGIDGNDFTMLKFRTMVPDAEAQLAQLRAEADDGNGVLFKLRDDPRVTRVGRVLRRFSLDELPQLVNVLRGDMSIVGPRPPLRTEVDEYGDDAVRRLRVKPGLTGLWQVSGRSDLSWDESLRLDLRYVDNWSMTLDLQILWRTTRAVLHGTGAY